MSTLDVLLVEDEVGIRTALAAYLRMNGKRVAEAASVHEALLVLEDEQPACVLCDERIGRESGTRVLEEYLRMHPRGAAALCTANLHAEAKRFLEQYPRVDSISKPVAPRTLLTWVEEKLTRDLIPTVISGPDDVHAQIASFGLSESWTRRISSVIDHCSGGSVRDVVQEDRWVLLVIDGVAVEHASSIPEKGCEAWSLSEPDSIAVRVHESVREPHSSARHLLWPNLVRTAAESAS